MEAPFIIILLIVWAGVVVAGYFVGKKKGKAGLGILLTALLGWIGLVIIAAIPVDKSTSSTTTHTPAQDLNTVPIARCKRCYKEGPSDARYCPHCGYPFHPDPAKAASGNWNKRSPQNHKCKYCGKPF